jgi:hypothetical protein
MQYNQQLYTIYSFYMIIRDYIFFFWSSKSSVDLDRAEIDLDSTGGSTPGSPLILLIWMLSSLSCHHALADWKFPLTGGEDSPSSNTSM